MREVESSDAVCLWSKANQSMACGVYKVWYVCI